MDSRRSPVPYLVLVVALLLSAVAAILLINGQHAAKQAAVATPAPQPAAPAPVAQPRDPLGPVPAMPERSPEEALADAGVGVKAPDPAKLVEQIGRALEKGDLQEVAKLVGRDVLDERSLARLRQLAVEKPLRLHPQRPFSEVGELKLNEETRWSLNLEGAAEDQRIFLDLVKRPDGWHVGRLVLPAAAGEPAQPAVLVDALGIADAFVQAVMVQNFQRAQGFVNPAKVSDAKIAALCILFEEGQYRLKREKPLRAVMVRPDMVAYLANVDAVDGSRSAQFSLTMEKDAVGARWVLADLNLDELLSDYAQRVAGGDIYYTPLVRNPAGGDTLVLYFGFDEASLSPRSARQLDIVAAVLRADTSKKLTISGHTDAKGADPYNASLSAQRAVAVKEFLATRGVDPNQMQTRAIGANQPRRPNLLEDGTDNPEGRKVNRRTEIYLDF